jgi:hypothetical protein
MVDIVTNHMGYAGCGTCVDYSVFNPFNSVRLPDPSRALPLLVLLFRVLSLIQFALIPLGIVLSPILSHRLQQCN